MKKYLALVIAIAVLLAPLYAVSAADARDSFSVQSGYVISDNIVKVEAGVQITHYAGIWFLQGDQMARSAFADKVDPTNFEIKYLFNKVPDRTRRAPAPWNPNDMVYDCWLNTTLLDTTATWDAANGGTNYSGICFMLRVTQTNLNDPEADNSNNIEFQGYLWYDGRTGWSTIWGDGYDGNYTPGDVDPQGNTFDISFSRSDAGVWTYKVNDIEVGIKPNFSMAIIDRVFYKGTWTYTPQYTMVGTVTTADCNVVTYDVPAVTEYKADGKIYIPAVTAFGKYVGPELEFFGDSAAVAPVAATTAYATGLYHPAVPAVTEFKSAGAVYVAPKDAVTAKYGPELTIVPAVTAYAGTASVTAGSRVAMTSYPGVAGSVPKSQKVVAAWAPTKVDGKMQLKDIYLKVSLSSAVADPFTVTVIALNGKSLFKDMTPPIIVCPANGGFYNDPTIDAYEQGEGKITEMWLANNWTSANASQTENGTQITDEGKGWLKVKNGTEELSAFSLFTVDHTAPVISGAAPASVVTGSVTITVTDDNLSTFRAISPVKGNTITWPSNNTFTAKGAYKIVATDKAGNMSQLAFTIK